MWSMLRNRPVWNAEGGSGGGAADAGAAGGGAADAAAKDAGSILYPDDPAKVDGAAKADDKTADAGKAEWKEYVPDPAKSADENAAAKAEHDKTKPAAADDPANKVPEDGKYDLKMPDGVELDAELAGALGPEFKELGLTNAQAQKLVDKYIETQQARAGKQGEAWANTVAGWVDEAKKDPEIGGAKWDGTVKVASGVVARFGNDALKEYLNASGAGNHPEMIRFMAKVGAMIGEDNPAISENPGKSVKPDTASILYPDDQPKGK